MRLGLVLGLGGMVIFTGVSCDQKTQQASAKEAWEQTARLMVNEAHETFAQLADKPGSTREARLGEGISLLGVQPKTQGNIDESEAIFREIIAEGKGDDAEVLARYFLGRSQQLHRFEPDIPAARDTYAELVQKFPGHPVGQLAVARLVTTGAFAENDRDSRAKVLREYERLSDQVTLPVAKGNYHGAMGELYLRLVGDYPNALRHFLLADQNWTSSPQLQASLKIRIGRLAEKTGQLELARDYYRQFIEEFPRDNRNYSVRLILEDLDRSAPKPAGAATSS